MRAADSASIEFPSRSRAFVLASSLVLPALGDLSSTSTAGFQHVAVYVQAICCGLFDIGREGMYQGAGDENCVGAYGVTSPDRIAPVCIIITIPNQ